MGEVQVFASRLPHHHKNNEVLGHNIIDRLDPKLKILLYSATSGKAIEKTYDELYTLLN